MKNIESINRVLERFPYLEQRKLGFPFVGKRNDGKEFSKEVKKVADGFELYDDIFKELYDPNQKEINLTSGNPMKYKPFKPTIEALKKNISSAELYRYPYSEGDNKVRNKLLNYIEQEGFINTDPYDYSDIDDKGLSINNITFTVSTSHAFGIILDIIAKENDVILMTGPNYGLFSFKPERINAKVEIISLDKEDNYLINPLKLSKKIVDINNKLKEEYKNSSYIPKVAAFINGNPCNPTGKVMSEKEIDILKEIGQVCLDNGVFIIDDLIYRDLTYDNNNIAKPIATIPGMFKNTISLLGLSKAYGLASLRAGLVVADEVIIRQIINCIFQEMDAVPSIIGDALAGSFNTSNKRNKEYNKYFKELNNEYKFRYNLLKSFIMGINSIKEDKIKKEIIKEIKKNSNYEICLDIINTGINGIDIITNLEPEAGFFAILDFTKLKGKTYNNKIIKNERDLLRFFYETIKLRFIVGNSLTWMNEDELIGRVTYAKDRSEIIEAAFLMNKAINMLR